MRSSEGTPTVSDEPGAEQQDPAPRQRGWRRFIKPVRIGVLLFIVALVVEYLVVPELVGASKDLYLLGRISAWWSRCSATRC